MQVKVCGMTQMNQVVQLDAMGVAYIGFIFYPASKRYVLATNTLEGIANLQLTHSSYMRQELTQLLEVEKQQIMQAVYDSMGTNFDPNMGRAEQYYNEKFKSE